MLNFLSVVVIQNYLYSGDKQRLLFYTFSSSGPFQIFIYIQLHVQERQRQADRQTETDRQTGTKTETQRRTDTMLWIVFLQIIRVVKTTCDTSETVLGHNFRNIHHRMTCD